MFRTLFCFLLVFAVPAVAQVQQGRPNVPEFKPAFENQTRAPEIADATRLRADRIASGLAHPWGIAVLPGGGYLVTERAGQLNHVTEDGQVTRIGGVPEVADFQQGGLLDVAIADDFRTTRRLFLTYSKPQGGDRAVTAAATGVLNAEMTALSEVTDIFVQTPAVRSGAHFGSRVVPTGDAVFVTTGDRGQGAPAQDLRSTMGKVIRVTPTGGIPGDNPFAGQPDALGEIWSYGHRNIQGAALHPETGELWTLEHGPKGGDELNRIAPGQNYGWPVVSYGENYDSSPVGQGRPRAEGIVEPRYYWDPVIAPGGFVFYEGDVFDDWQGDVVAASLRPGGLVRLKLDGDRVTGEARYLRDLGRIRDVAIDRDGALLVVTDDPEGGLFRITPR